jgi:acetoin utilization protein AcuC
MVPTIYDHPLSRTYRFSDNHPLNPERLDLAMAELAAAAPQIQVAAPQTASESDAELVHAPEYIEAVKNGGPGHGFESGDNPPFPGMFEAALAYSSASMQMADDLVAGSRLGVSFNGGLHHARYDEASGFCVFNDPAMAIARLKNRFQRILYVDIDLHHGDGVQWLWYKDPDVVTYSIHQDGRTLYPGTGGTDETGRDFSAINIPLPPDTTGPVWLWAFQQGLEIAVNRCQPQAVVLQMGCDAHFSDPLGHLNVRVEDWLEAVRSTLRIGVPLMACGGGGYELENVERMWPAAALTLFEQPFDSAVYFDLIIQPEVGRPQAEEALAELRAAG